MNSGAPIPVITSSSPGLLSGNRNPDSWPSRWLCWFYIR
jgi:hypothetical protein